MTDKIEHAAPQVRESPNKIVGELSDTPTMPAGAAPDMVRMSRDTWNRLVTIHRGWCNYCHGEEMACLGLSTGGCSLRDCLLSAHESERSEG